MDRYKLLSGCDPGNYRSTRVAVAMSGGIDSSLAAALLKDAGFDVVGVTMHLWDAGSCPGIGPGGCAENTAVRDACQVAGDLGIPHHAFDLRGAFEQSVVQDFADTYLHGRTPNPCVQCNRHIKWGALRRHAADLGCELIATGHYARIARFDDDTHALYAGTDTRKDQSYFLWGLGHDDLAATLFPLGAMTKDKTREETARRGLRSLHRSESQEICFIPHNDYGAFLRSRYHDQRIPALESGDIIDIRGTVIGSHPGAAFFTIGQRRGLGIALGYPAYVVAIDTKKNTVTVGRVDGLLSHEMRIVDIVWSRGRPVADVFRCKVRIRYRHTGAPAEVRVVPGGAVVMFDESQRAITPGQSAVFYDGDMVLGGGIIV